MNVWESVRIALRALRVNKLRSALTMLGIIIGVGAVIAMVGVGAGAQESVTEYYLEARDWPLVAGRSLGPEDVDGATKVAVLGQTTALNLFGETDPLGQIVRIQKVPFTVIGLLDEKGESSYGYDQDDLVLIPLSTAKTKVLGTSLANPRSVRKIEIKIRPGEDLTEAEAEIRTLLRQRHRLQPGNDDNFKLGNLTDVLEAKEQAAQVMTYLLAAIASVSLLVGGIGIMNIMLVSVTERTREIGLRMAVGAADQDILLQFLVEAVTLAVIGGVVGIAAGLAGSRAISYFAEWRTLVMPDTIVLAFGFAAAIGIFFGFYPARKAARLDRIETRRLPRRIEPEEDTDGGGEAEGHHDRVRRYQRSPLGKVTDRA